MWPFIQIFGKEIATYSLMALLGIFSTGMYVSAVERKNGRDDNNAIILLLFSGIGVFVGGHSLYAMVNYKAIINFVKYMHNYTSLEELIHAITFIFGGNVFFGGLLGGILVGYIYLYNKPNLKYLIDVITPGIPLFHFWGRIGCFLAGCCYGIENKLGIVLQNSIIPEANGVKRFPIQILESGFNLCLFIILDRLRYKKYFVGNMLNIYLMMYAIGRFFIEFLRGDDYRGKILYLSTSQIISVFILVFLVLKYIKTQNGR